MSTKILIINGEPFQDVTATGITLKSIFKNIPKERISFIHVSKISPDLEYSNNVFSFFKNQLEYSLPSQKVHKLSSKQAPLFSRLKNELRQWNDLATRPFSDQITEYIIQSNAGLIYSTLGNLKVISLVLYAQRILNCKIVPHFMDDWKETIFEPKRFFWHNFILKRKLFKIVSHSKIGMAISEKMAQEYENHYNITFLAVMNTIPDFEIARPSNLFKKNFTIVYTGGLHLNRWKSLLVFSEALKNVSADFSFSFEIYSPFLDKELYEKHFEIFSFVKFMGHVPVNQINKILSRADFFVHCESFEPNVIKYTRLSISTKIPSYLKMGKPIIAIGPKDVESIDYLERYNAAFTITDLKLEDMTNQLTNLFNQNVDLNLIVENGSRLVKKNHSYSSIRNSLSIAFD
jgi:glycosyltransferase involved in cell wall biosynthesis